MNFTLAGNEVVLLAEKALWVPSQKCLVVADLHIGKIEHFRAAGIAVPSQANMHTLLKLATLITHFRPEKVVFLGDLFHSVRNQSYDDLQTFLSDAENIEFILVMGNHDIMSESAYQMLGLTVVDDYFLDNLWLTHEPQTIYKPDFYNLAGHIHPGVRLKGKGKQGLTLPCFYFHEYYGVLPAFGYFTGKAILKMDKKSTIFAIADDKIIHIPNS
jgi:DNA ligase-associated metallophosphoesterase